MRQSRYDADHDGLCDANACEDVAAYYFDASPEFTAMAPIVRANAAKIGIKVTLHGSDSFYDDIAPPESKIPLALFPGWGKDYLNAAQFFEPLFAEGSIGNANFALTGATDEQLREAGYATRSVPSVDDRIRDCQARIGRSQLECWTGLDQYLMEQVVPWIPVFEENHIQVIPARIVNYSFDQAAIAPALEQIALKPPTPSGGSS
jgi:ABC-type transport system substrate-binding protein